MSGGKRNLKATGAVLISYDLSINSVAWGDADLTSPSGGMAANAKSATGNANGDTYAITGATTTALTSQQVVGTYLDSVTVTLEW